MRSSAYQARVEPRPKDPATGGARRSFSPRPKELECQAAIIYPSSLRIRLRRGAVFQISIVFGVGQHRRCLACPHQHERAIAVVASLR